MRRSIRATVAAAEADVASAEMTQQPARALIRREPVSCEADRPLREVARLMRDENVNSMVVRGEQGELGIVTDSDLRSRVVAEGMSVDVPVGEVVPGPLTTVGADDAGADVMLAMLDNDVRHVGVLSPRGELLGVLGGIDLVAAEARPLRFGTRSREHATSGSSVRRLSGSGPQWSRCMPPSSLPSRSAA
jgi:CBS domain-containing protein